MLSTGPQSCGWPLHGPDVCWVGILIFLHCTEQQLSNVMEKLCSFRRILKCFRSHSCQSFFIKSEKGYVRAHTQTHTHTEFWVTLSRRVDWWKWGPFWRKLNLGLSLFSGKKRLLLGRDRCGRDENWKKIKRDAFLGQVSSVVKSTVLAQPCLYNFWQNTVFGS